MTLSVVNANVAAVVFVSVVLCGAVGASVSPQSGTATGADSQAATDRSLGGDISVFMQRGTAGANGSVDSGMWLAAFESAQNQTRKEALVTERATTLRIRVADLEARLRAFPTRGANGSVAYRAQRARLVADAAALRTSVSEAKTAAASEGVNTSALDRVSRRVENLSVPPATVSNRTQATVRDVRADGATYRGP